MYKQMPIDKQKNMQLNMENIIMIKIKHCWINQISTLTKSQGVDMPLNINQIKFHQGVWLEYLKPYNWLQTNCYH